MSREERHKHNSSGATAEEGNTLGELKDRREDQRLDREKEKTSLRCSGMHSAVLPYISYWPRGFICVLLNYFTAVLSFVLLTPLSSREILMGYEDKLFAYGR